MGPNKPTVEESANRPEQSVSFAALDSSSSSANQPIVSSGPVLDAPFNGALQPVDPKSVDQGSLLDQVSTSMSEEEAPFAKKRFSRQRAFGLSLLLFGCVATILLGVRIEANKSKAQEASLATPSARFQQQQVPLSSLNKQLGGLNTNSSVTVNGQLQVASSIVLQPSTQTGPAVTGQMYYDSATNTVVYYNGKRYVTLQGGGNTSITNNSSTTNVTNITNVSGGGFSGTGTPGTLAMFASATTLSNSLITESGTTLNVGSATGAATTNMQGGSGGVNISTATVDGATGGVSILSGSSVSSQAGDIDIDTGSGLVDGTIIYSTGFESGLGFWGIYTGGGVQCLQSAAYAHTGTYSLEVSGTSGPSCVDSQQVTPGHQYLLSAWTMNAAGAGDAIANINWNPTGGSIGPDWATCAQTAVTNTGWTHLQCVARAPVGMNYANMLLGLVSGGTVEYFDDVTLTDMSNATGSQLKLGATNAQGVTVGNMSEIGTTSLLGGNGVNVNAGAGPLTMIADGVSVDSGAGDVDILTDTSSATSGNITIQTGDSSTTSSGNVTVDTGVSAVVGTVVADHTFETSADDFGDAYGYVDTIAKSTAQSHSGSGSLAITSGGGEYGGNTGFSIGEGTPYATPGIPGDNYLFSGWVLAGTNPRAITCSVDWSTDGYAGGGSIEDDQWCSVTDSVGQWKHVSATITAPPNTTSMSLEFFNSTAPVGEVHYFDDMTVTDISTSPTASQLSLGANNAAQVTIGNTNQTAPTSIYGHGINLNAGQSVINVTGGGMNFTGKGAITLDSGGGPNGNGVVVTNQAASTTAFTVQGAGVTMLNVDTANKEISLGTGAGTSIGYNKVGARTDGGTGINTITASKFTTTTGGDISSMSAYFGGTYLPSPNNQYGFAIYADNAGVPGAYIASSNIGTLGTSGAWQSLPVSATLDASTVYWLVYWQNSNQVSSKNGVNYDNGLGGALTVDNTFAWQTGGDEGWPATFPTTSLDTVTGMDMSIYATFASASPALTIDRYGTLTQSGGSLFQDPTDSSQAFQVENSLGTALITGDTAAMTVTVGGTLVVNGDITVNGNIAVNGHIITSGTTPQIAAGAAACTSPTVGITGNDTSGTVTITTGTGCSGGGTLATITFADAYTNNPNITLTPANAAASALQYYNGTSVGADFTVDSNNVPSGSTVYKWHYWAAQ